MRINVNLSERRAPGRKTRGRLRQTPLFRGAFLEVDLLVAVAILALAIVPLGFSFAHERSELRADYYRAVTNEIVDGEIEVLAAGRWQEFPDGSHIYTVHSGAAKNLPRGHFELTKNGKHLRLEWMPDVRQGVGTVVREVTVQ
jgi:hypothetical protein